MAEKQKQHSVGLGVGLILLGILLLLSQFGLVGQHIFMYVLAIGFLAAYQWAGGNQRYGTIGFLIPGCVILAIALFSDIDRLTSGLFFGPGWFFLLLGAAFFAIYYVHTRVAGQDSGSRQWPLYPAGGLAGFGLFIAVVTQLEALQRAGFLRWVVPVLLIVVGAYLLLRRQKPSQGQ